MLKYFKKIAILAPVLVAVHSAVAFTIWGPAESYQVPALDYVTRAIYGTTELGGPKNFGEGSRLNVPVITYAYDYTFLNYFGAQGVKAIDSAFSVFNALPDASSAVLSRYGTQGVEQFNYTAQAMGLVDLKTAMMGVIIEHMGLLGETHVYDLSDRRPQATGSCLFDYRVINRNYDPVTFNPSDYVNGLLYTYRIVEECPVISVGDAVESLVDTTAPINVYTAVATKEALDIGGLFYSSLSRDDVGGLRYLYRRNNFNLETLDPNAVISSTLSGFQIFNNTQSNSINTNTAGIYGGVERIRFVKVGYDSLVGTAFNPVISHYTMTLITNGQERNISVARTITRPDIIISAADLSSGTPVDPFYSRSATFYSNGVASVGGGTSSQVLAPQWNVVFDNVGAQYENAQSFYLNQGTSQFYPIFNWASYDGSGKAPIVYPNGASILALQNQVLSGSSYLPPGTYNPYVGSTNGSTTNTTVATTLSQ